MNEVVVVSLFLFLVVSALSLVFVGMMIVWDMIAGNYEPNISFRSIRTLVYGLFKKG